MGLYKQLPFCMQGPLYYSYLPVNLSNMHHVLHEAAEDKERERSSGLGGSSHFAQMKYFEGVARTVRAPCKVSIYVFSWALFPPRFQAQRHQVMEWWTALGYL